jgi:hypothetical protein
MNRQSKMLIQLAMLIGVLLSGCVDAEKQRGDVDKHGSEFLKCELKLNQEGKNVWADITIQNVSSNAVPVLKRNLVPNGELEWSAFEIVRDGQRVAYRGPTIKAPSPKQEDFYQLKSGERVHSKVRLNTYYDLSYPGTYTVQFRALNPHLDGGKLEVMQSAPALLKRN